MAGELPVVAELLHQQLVGLCAVFLHELSGEHNRILGPRLAVKDPDGFETGDFSYGLGGHFVLGLALGVRLDFLQDFALDAAQECFYVPLVSGPEGGLQGGVRCGVTGKRPRVPRPIIPIRNSLRLARRFGL